VVNQGVFHFLIYTQEEEGVLPNWTSRDHVSEEVNAILNNRIVRCWFVKMEECQLVVEPKIRRFIFRLTGRRLRTRGDGWWSE